MCYKFLDSAHQERFETLLKKDRTNPKDTERLSMFYIFAVNSDLFSKSKHLYNFFEHWIEPDALREVDLSHGTRALVLLAYNLYNGFECPSVRDVFCYLDHNCFEAAMNAIKIRFGRMT